MNDLTPQQQRFVEEYLIDNSSQTKAAIRAGYSIPSATVSASRLMKDPRVRAAIEEGQAERAKRMGITQDRVLQELMLIAFGNPKDALSKDEDGKITINLDNLTREYAAALGEVTVQIEEGKNKTKRTKFTAVKPSDRLVALEKLGKHLGMFVEKVEHTGVLSLEQLVTESMQEDKSIDLPVDDSPSS